MQALLKRLKDVNNIGYHQAVVKIKGKIVEEDAPIEDEFRADDDKFHSF
jgi:translation elongation factor P/translation initiation factor 5A